MDTSLHNLIGPDILIMRKRYDEALQLQGVPAKYQYPILATTNVQSESVVDRYSVPEDTYIFFDGNPRVKTFKRYGWVVENSDELPFLIHCSFQLEHLQRDAIFRIAGMYTDLPDRVFRVTEITYDMVAADHLICQVIPVYDESKLVGRTDLEVKQQFHSSHYFLKEPTDYRGSYHTTKDDIQ